MNTDATPSSGTVFQLRPGKGTAKSNTAGVRRSGGEASQDVLRLGLKAFHGPCGIIFTLAKGHKKIFGGKGVMCVLGETILSMSP